MTGTEVSAGRQPSIPERIVDRFTYPADHPLSALTGYYLPLFAVGGTLMYFIPPLRQVVSGELLAEMIAGGAHNSLSSQSGASSSVSFGWMFTSRPLLLTHPVPSGLLKEKNGKRAEVNGVLVVRTRQDDETINRLPKETAPEQLEDAILKWVAPSA